MTFYKAQPKSAPTPKILLRSANEEDISFIFNSWLKSFRNSFFCKGIVNSVYFTEHHKLIEKILKTASAVIACNPEDPSQVYGWICAEEIDGVFCMHYLYVKHSFRGLGIGRLLFNTFTHESGLAGIYTHQTRASETLGIKLNLIYHPYVLFSSYKRGDDNA
jgi:GNAT superfamily N-acetyltransferase